MIDAREFLSHLSNLGVDTFVGVPDSLLSEFIEAIDSNAPPERNVIAPNEGSAVGIAMGHYLASGKVALVYMQNSGLGNAHNPIVSLGSPEIYGIPMMLVIGWRGEPGRADEPQHLLQGAITKNHLKLLGVPFLEVGPGSNLIEVVSWISDQLRNPVGPIALLVRDSSFVTMPHLEKPSRKQGSLSREDALREILRLSKNSIIISTTGKTSRELFELREQQGDFAGDFLTVGGMGHASSIALGVALGNKDLDVICIDGDGALVMHMGALATIGDAAPRNLTHIVLNNRVHESVGGQPTLARSVRMDGLALSCGYSVYKSASSVREIEMVWQEVDNQEGPRFFEIKIAPGSRPDLGRPNVSPKTVKELFMKKVKNI